MTQPMLLNNRYQLQESLGRGGMALVYRGYDRTLERQVAIKILRQDFVHDATFRERFRQEAKAAANLAHPNIVTVHDFGMTEDSLFIVMEHIPGTDLKSLIKRRGRLPLEEALPLIIQACAGVGYAHRAGLVHCDIKPHNMLVTPDQRLKVTDFGIARALASIRPDEQSSVVWGSPQYFAPEQAAGGAPSPASDVYALGVTLYEMLTGQLPFNGTTAAELAQQHRYAPPPAPRSLNPSLPIGIEEILFKVLAKEPAARYRTADQFGRILLTLKHQIETHSTPISDTATPVARTLPKPSPAPVAAHPVDDSIDWLTVGLALLALLAVGGLIPFWMWVYFIYNPPLH